MSEARSHKDLIVWQKSMEAVTLAYEFTQPFPDTERFGLLTQIRRSAVSIPSNIAEGRRRGTKKDFRQFLLIAFGSGAELETQLEIAKRLGYGKASVLTGLESLLEEIMKMLNAMIAKLQ